MDHKANNSLTNNGSNPELLLSTMVSLLYKKRVQEIVRKELQDFDKSYDVREELSRLIKKWIWEQMFRQKRALRKMMHFYWSDKNLSQELNGRIDHFISLELVKKYGLEEASSL
jgi:hypothetical protein